MRNEDRQDLVQLRKIDKALANDAERLIDQQTGSYTRMGISSSVEAQVRGRSTEISSKLAELERANQQLHVAREIAEQANHSKTRFLAAASHDVLQPLNAALLLMSSLSTKQSDNEGRKLCRQVERSLETMDTLLRNLLYISRLDAGDVSPQFQCVSLDSLFDSIASDFDPIARVRNLELRVRQSGLHVWSDPTMLRRTIQNVVANALRYTKNGGALVAAGRHGDRVHIRIADTGVGIDRKHYKDIFVEFQRCTQGQHDADGAASGMGLGLAIVERMMHTLNHSLTLNSRLGHGSCFSLTLPHEDSSPNAQKPATRAYQHLHTLSRARILIIEHDPAAQQTMEVLLGQWGCDLRLASSASEAKNALGPERAWAPDIIIADQHLIKGERGTSVVRVMQQLLARPVPAIIITADPSEHLRKMAHQGQLEVMQKPVKPAQLRALLTHLITRAFEDSAQT